MTDQIITPDAEQESRWGKFTIGKALAAAAVTTWLVFWIWAFAIASPSNPNELNTISYGANSEAVCAAANAQINAMPSPRTSKTPQDRADQMQVSNKIVEGMITELHAEADQLTDADDVELVSKWLEDYDAYLADRQRYAEKLSTADGTESAIDLAFTLTQRVSGGVYTTRIDTFARANKMPSCQVPGDV